MNKKIIKKKSTKDNNIKRGSTNSDPTSPGNDS